MKKSIILYALVSFFVIGAFTCPLGAAYVYPLECFTDNGDYVDILNVFVEVDGTDDYVDFTFRNQSSFSSAISEIYFEQNTLLGSASLSNGPGVLFAQFAKPKNLPAGRSLNPAFLSSGEFTFDSEPAPPKNGINPDEWLRITFDLNIDVTFAFLLDRLNTDNLRIGAHIIALPDGSSESAVTTPEPATIALLAFGSLAMFNRRNKFKRD
jgi:hypothetical protein